MSNRILGYAALGLFIRTYCDAHNIECNGDVFGVVFSGAEEFTERQAVEIIEMAADLYNLREKKEMTS